MEPNSLRRGRREASFGAEPRTLATTTSKPSAPVSDSVRWLSPFAAVGVVRDHRAHTGLSAAISLAPPGRQSQRGSTRGPERALCGGARPRKERTELRLCLRPLLQVA